MKGISDIISTILIVNVLIVITTLVYFWGMPIIEKNIDLSTLTKGEDFLKLLDSELVDIARKGGSTRITFPFSGIIKINSTGNYIEYTIESTGVLYNPGSYVCFNKNCDIEVGEWGNDTYSVRRVVTKDMDNKHFETIYSVYFRNLTYEDKIYRINLKTQNNITLTGSKGSQILISKNGERIEGNSIIIDIYLDIL
ncbi:MAG: hypothetical protein B6U88_00415 [Candidatus Aenigmarchaeota archaeon ex4484_56]|nr:MAG: hypothetical protein B6U88_00415 [Candidatus Aenigmarchaeota archaeon ex4484_56]